MSGICVVEPGHSHVYGELTVRAVDGGDREGARVGRDGRHVLCPGDVRSHDLDTAGEELPADLARGAQLGVDVDVRPAGEHILGLVSGQRRLGGECEDIRVGCILLERYQHVAIGARKPHVQVCRRGRHVSRGHRPRDRAAGWVQDDRRRSGPIGGESRNLFGARQRKVEHHAVFDGDADLTAE